MQTIEPTRSRSPIRASSSTATIPDCIAACIECSQACVACADACLAEDEVMLLRRCIRLDYDCADICAITARILSRLFEDDTHVVRAQLEACALSCATCGTECHLHAAHHEHCRLCADACLRCEEACQKAAITLDLARS